MLAAAQDAGCVRIEARVHDGYAAGCTLVRHLGFDIQAYKELWWPSGAGVFEYALLHRLKGTVP